MYDNVLKLLPCPFCGYKEISLITTLVGSTKAPDTASRVECDFCEAQTGSCEFEEEAVSIWNKREEWDERNNEEE